MSLLTEHFSREEFACHDGTPLPEALVPDTIRLCKNLEVLRAALGKPITILSGYRSPEHNGAVNGADHSLHLVGKAADIVVNGYKPADVHAKIEELIDELKSDYTIVIVTHNMQQAARVSDFTAFMYLGELIEFDSTTKIFTAPSDRRTQDYITGRFG